MTARSIAVALLVAVSFCMAFLRWKFTVLAEIGRISAISATVLPSADQRKISISRSVKEILQNLPICLVAVSHRWHPQHL